MPLKPGTSNTVTLHKGVGTVSSSTKDPFVGLPAGHTHQDYKTMTIAQASITEANPGVFTSVAHGLETNDLITYHTEGGTALVTSAATASDGDDFYVKWVSADTFQITSAPNGTGLQVTNDGNDNQTFARAVGRVT
jgi:hypothetical protein